MTLFDIGHADAFNLIKVDEDRQFLLGQRCPDGPRGIMQGVDQSLADRERRRVERGVLRADSHLTLKLTLTRTQMIALKYYIMINRQSIHTVRSITNALLHSS